MDTGETPDDGVESGHELENVPPTEGPRPGTLAWLKTQPHEDVQGLTLPACHRVGNATLLLGDDDGRCRVIKPDGARCGSSRLRSYGVCIVHAGGGGFLDPKAMSARAHAVKVARRERRELLGIGPRRAASARAIAGVQAMERAEQLATAIVSAPLDDASLGTIERQKAALAALDATFPLAHTSVELSIPASEQDVAQLGWAEMRQLASQLLGEQAELPSADS